jgi:hypothetical protein
MAPNSAPACNDHPGKTTCLGHCFRMTAVSPNSELTFRGSYVSFTGCGHGRVPLASSYRTQCSAIPSFYASSAAPKVAVPPRLVLELIV